MNELIEKDQVISIVPQDFRKSTKGKVLDVQKDKFTVKTIHSPQGILVNNLIEFYSKTDNGILYFESDITNIAENVVTVKKPVKHRFLQRRQFTRIKYLQELNFIAGENVFKIKTLDLSAGGMKLSSDIALDIDVVYDITIPLMNEQGINCKFQLIRIEKNADEFYTVSGRFINLSNIDRMALIQFCVKKNIENVSRNG